MPNTDESATPDPTAQPSELEPMSPEFAERRCWRCLKMFPGDAAAGPSPTADFWLCGPCDATLLPERAGRH